MYIQLLTECNMSCAHCMMSCARGVKGEYMSRETYARAIKFAADYGDTTTLGGGEPTMHKEFFDYLDFALRANLEQILVITNGGFKKKALKLLDYQDRYGEDVLNINLSQDIYHDTIDEEVVEAYEGRNLIRSCEPEGVIYMGNAVENQLYNHTRADGCYCEGMFIKPNGDLTLCACTDAEILCNINEISDEQFDNFNFEYSDFVNENGGEPCHSSMTESDYDIFKKALYPNSLEAVA